MDLGQRRVSPGERNYHLGKGGPINLKRKKKTPKGGRLNPNQGTSAICTKKRQSPEKWRREQEGRKRISLRGYIPSRKTRGTFRSKGCFCQGRETSLIWRGKSILEGGVSRGGDWERGEIQRCMNLRRRGGTSGRRGVPLSDRFFSKEHKD